MIVDQSLHQNFQAQGKVQGDWFEDTCVRILTSNGFKVDDRRVNFHDAGVEVDIIATGQAGDVSFYITCKGSYQGNRPGCARTDTLKKAVAEALALHSNGWGPVVLLTSHLPSNGFGYALLHSTSPDILFDAIEPTTSTGLRRIRFLANATEDQLRNDLTVRRTAWEMRQKNGRWT